MHHTFKCTIQQALVHLRCCATITTSNFTFPLLQKEILCPSAVIPCSHHQADPGNHSFFCDYEFIFS